jgi:tetratricopeptide (TPR) repeat protein
MLLFVIVACCLYNRYPTYNAYKEWKNLKMLYQMQLYDRLPNGYERLSAALADRNDFLFEYGQSLSKTENYVKSNIILLKGQQRSSDPMFYNIVGKNYQALKQYKNAEENFIMAANCVPHKLYPYYLLAKLYIETGDSLKFRRAAEILMSKEPKVQSSAVKEMRDEIKRMISDISDSFRQINEQQTNNEFSPLPRAQIEILLVILQTK